LPHKKEERTIQKTEKRNGLNIYNMSLQIGIKIEKRRDIKKKGSKLNLSKTIF
jgi:NMD protein affecting ribosome stability and mRNA decay